ncbi:hypothetical protein SDC9_172277 [bioreactor metagenome]|uniref:Uncharacterized protein n=1 Tax=bioreactor metagenome TaxID=1076179 RepID=A0A645GFR1_9ZZZZ
MRQVGRFPIELFEHVGFRLIALNEGKHDRHPCETLQHGRGDGPDEAEEHREKAGRGLHHILDGSGNGSASCGGGQNNLDQQFIQVEPLGPD